MFLFAWWCVRWSLALIVFVAVMAGAGYYVFNEALRGGSYVEVPDVTRRPVTEASYVLADKGLEIGRQERVADDRFPKYYVISQRPSAGRVVRTGRRVTLTVSAGSESLTPPTLIGKALDNAMDELTRTPFGLGSVCRIPSEITRDTVLAQDPPPARLLARGDRISLLVSDGQPRAAFIMPDIMGKPVQEVMSLLAPRGVRLVPKEVDMPGQRVDVVLDQIPAAGRLVQEGDVVTYSVRSSGVVEMPDARRPAKVSYTVPNSWYEREVRIDTIDRHGARATRFPTEKDYVNGEAPRYSSGTTITLPLNFIDSMTVEIYLDGQLAESRYYEGDKPPVVKQFSVQ